MRRIGLGWALVTMLLLFPACGDSGPVGGLAPQGVFLPGDFGPVLQSPDRELLLVRSIEPGDTWVVDEFGRQHRPRLSLVRTLSGTLQPINERTGVHLSFPKAGGVLHGRLTGGDRVGTLLYTANDGATTTVLDDYAGFLDWYSVIPVSRRLDPTDGVLLRPSTSSVFPAPGFVFWASDTAATRVVGVEAGSVTLWNLDEGTKQPLWDVSSETGVYGTISADGTWAYVIAASWMRAFDLGGGTSRLVEGAVAVRPHIQSFALEPGGPSFYFVDDEGLKRVTPASAAAELLAAGRVASHERTRNGRWWLLELDMDPLDYCYRMMVVDLESGATSASVSRVCPEVVGYAVLSAEERHVLWSDGPFNSMASAFAAFSEIQYCAAFACLAPATIAPDDRWLLVPTASSGCGTGDACTMMRFDLDDPAGGLVPLFAAEHNYDWYFADYVRFARGSPALTFGVETLSRNPAFGPCPNELRVALRGTWETWNVDVAVKDVEVAADDTLVYATGRPDLPAACPGWPEPAGLVPGLRIVPASWWTTRR